MPTIHGLFLDNLLLLIGLSTGHSNDKCWLGCAVECLRSDVSEVMMLRVMMGDDASGYEPKKFCCTLSCGGMALPLSYLGHPYHSVG